MYHRSFLLACLVALLSLISAQTTAESTTEGYPTPPPGCCLPDQFTISRTATVGAVRSGPLGRLGGQLAILEDQYAAYDFNNSRIGAYIIRNILQYPDHTEYMRLIEDTNEGTVWIIDLGKQTCRRENAVDYPFHLERCPTAWLTYQGAVYLGDKAYKSHSWYTIIPEEYPSHGYISYTHDEDCIPTGESFGGVSVGWGLKQQIVSSAGFYDFAEGIENPDDYFELPDFCKEKSRKGGRDQDEEPERPGRQRKQRQ